MLSRIVHNQVAENILLTLAQKMIIIEQDFLKYGLVCGEFRIPLTTKNAHLRALDTPNATPYRCHATPSSGALTPAASA